MEERSSILRINDLAVQYQVKDYTVNAIRNINLEIYKKETYGIVGESGCGKSTLAFTMMNYLGKNGKVISGSVFYKNTIISTLSERELQKIWGKEISIVYQNPLSSLNPSIVVGEQIAEVVRIHSKKSKMDSWNEAISIMEKLNIPDPEQVARRYPHQMSGGMQQRICIAMALICTPELLILDEPTTGLDVTTAIVILDLIKDLKKKFNTTVIFITHNLGIITKVADRVGVIYMGRIVEEGEKNEIFLHPLHPYTQGLINCIPKIKLNYQSEKLNSIPGYVMYRDRIPEGCAFKKRCKYADRRCDQDQPLVDYGNNHLVACWHADIVHTAVNQSLEVKTSSNFIEIGDQEKEDKTNEEFLNILEVKKYYEGKLKVKALDGISLSLKKHKTLGIVGESGSGKSTLALCIEGLQIPNEGKIFLDKKDITVPWNKREKEAIRKMQMVFQNSNRTLNPSKTVKEQLLRPLKLFCNQKRKELEGRIIELLQEVGLNESYINRIPMQMSDGEKQRVAIARVFCCNPELIICDEPTSSLDVSIQASIINMLIELQNQTKISYLFISHDMNIVHYVSDYIAVMYLGKLCEYGRTEGIFDPPYHPYTEALLSAIPIADPTIEQKIIRLEGSIPSAINIPPGCRFNSRCPRKIGPICEQEEPSVKKVGENHFICCHIPVDELNRVKPVITG
ncbi:MAG: ABC transporter ATP-binding protein [Atribacterota bacterium]|nr:ABC transporter ATP-binding protein [Atribacterota bacterium]